MLLTSLALIASGCGDDTTPAETATTLSPTTETGDGDGDMSGDGDGDGDPATGDGDGDVTGDGDGDMSGDGDGDPIPSDCGDGVVEGSEECDDGNEVEDDGCTNACTLPACGDAIVQQGEECDVGNETMFCDGDCTYAVCGDGYHNMLAEECDDGNDDNTDGCVGACQLNVCGDGILWEGMEACDDGNEVETDACTNACVAATCGDGVVWEDMETCDDQNEVETDACTNACQLASCGDGVLWEGMETCDDGNLDDSDACPGSCAPAVCGDGFTYAGFEECDDGNEVEDDGCTNDCIANFVPIGDLTLGGNAYPQVELALDTIGDPYVIDDTQWLPAGEPGDVLIMSNNGSGGGAPDYSDFLANGGHILMIGGSSLAEFCTFVDSYFTTDGSCSWHQASDCTDDWNSVGNHPMTALVPPSYEFGSQNISFHMTHFAEGGQPGGVTLLGRTCHQEPDNYVLATRKYNGGGTFTYMALHLGPYADPDFQAGFLVPFLDGYLGWLMMGAP